MEDMVQRALELGFESLGFSDHAPSPYEEGVAIPAEQAAAYRKEFKRVREKYGDRIELYLGMERDFAAPAFDPAGLDYFIGSVHILFDRGGRLHVMDYKPEMLEAAIRDIGGGDVKELVRAYFHQVAAMLERDTPPILGHLDIVKKNNDEGRFWDEGGAWYEALCGSVVEKIAASGSIVEVNTALLQREGRREPYPSPLLLSLLREQNVPVTVSSDSHRTGTLNFRFGEACELLRRIGYRSVKMLKGGRFIDVEI